MCLRVGDCSTHEDRPVDMEVEHSFEIGTTACDVGIMTPSPVEASINPVPSRAESGPFPITERNEFELSQLWGPDFRQNVHEILCHGLRDLFADLQEALINKAFVPDTLILPPSPDELPDDRSAVDDEDGRGVTHAQPHMIENTETDNLEHAIPADKTPKVISQDSPYFPWPTKAVRTNIATIISPLTNGLAFPDGTLI